MATGRRCAMGKHFANVTLRIRAESWAMHDVVIAGCGEDGMQLKYGSAVKGPASAKAAVVKSKSNITNN
jgi:hypothetical protein